MIEHGLTLHMAQYLLDNCFSSKKVMADQLNIPYRALLRLFNGQNSMFDTENIMMGMAQYCLQRRIPPEDMVHGFCLI